MIQPQINSLVVAGRFQHALTLMDDHQESYGEKNHLLYLLDYGLVLQLAGQYEESVHVFEEAKRKYDDLYTVSLSQESLTWLVNDNLSPYRPEDFERVMINIFQAMNFAVLGDFEEALVEARDVDVKLSVINAQYSSDQQNVYKEDAFARFLMGIFYQCNGTMADLNDAYISYARAVEIYEKDYALQYQTPLPDILKENILAVAQWMGEKEFEFYRQKFPDIFFTGLEEKGNKGEVYLIHYSGFSPIKHQGFIPIPLPDEYIVKIAFPKYSTREYDSTAKIFKAVSVDKKVFKEKNVVGENISAIAIENLKNRKARVIAKGIFRSAGKYFLVREIEKSLRKQYGEKTSKWFKYLGNLYNVSSEQIDLRSWQTLPAEIRISRLILDPGKYQLSLENRVMAEEIQIHPGDKRFFIIRTSHY